MRSALLTKAALCICPPAIVATTAATLPPVRKAIHHLTQPSAVKPVARAVPPCVPLERQTFASTLPSSSVDTPIDLESPPVGMSAITPSNDTPIGPGALNPSGSTPGGPGIVTPNDQTTPDTPPAVPEPAAWSMMVIGFGLVGAGYRQRRRQVVRGRALALAGGVPTIGVKETVKNVGAMVGGGVASMATFVTTGAGPVQASGKLAQLGSKSLTTSILAKTAMCVCPPVAMAVATAAIPPVRHAVYSATAPATPKNPITNAALNVPTPCVPVSVPTAAEAVKQSGDELAVFKPTPSWPG